MCITPISFPNPTQWLCKNVSDGGSNWTVRAVKNNFTNNHQWNMSMSTMTNWPCPPCPRAPCPYILVINCQKSGCQYFSWKFQMGILFIYGNKFCDLKTLPRSIMSTKKTTNNWGGQSWYPWISRFPTSRLPPWWAILRWGILRVFLVLWPVKRFQEKVLFYFDQGVANKILCS